MVAIISSPTVYICIICRYESALKAAIQKHVPERMIDAMIENYPEDINARDEDGM